ncbi:restriction endonuclease [Clostridium tunisiense]|uniref:restriction endonuclease n=1 Tax=Clostridium tunisiense TaxID=219748 RepID=UPI0002FBF809|nr:restriction endonuclease [Clostridium tunisiense]
MEFKDYDTFEEWLTLVEANEEVLPRFSIPYQEWVDEYIGCIENKSEDEVKALVRCLLFPFTRNLDVLNYKTHCSIANNVKAKTKGYEQLKELVDNSGIIEYYRRIKNVQEAWEGLTWVIQLLPFHPYKAINALKLYLDAEIMYMPDDRIIGISQCIEIIEAKFIHTNKGFENSILNLQPREFEMLIASLYRHIGYEVVVTSATRDGGKDIIARIQREDGKETVYVECKLYKTTQLTNDNVKSFAYNVIKDNINRGVMFCTGYVSDKLRELDSRIQIWSLEEIIILLNAHLGSDWNKRLDRFIRL